MMTLIRKLVLAACSVLLCLSYSASNAQTLTTGTLDPTQVYNTGNLTTFDPTGSTTTSAWQNVGQWGGSLSCWSPGGPGYCGPQPYVNANGYGMINFSWGYTDLYQDVNIAAALPNSGSGLRINGYNFGFTAKNGNGWDNSQTDYLMAYVNLYGPTGKSVYSKAYDLTWRYDWTNFYFSETFTNPYATKDLSTARYGFVGYDTNGWAGPYGPEIYNVSFSLKYSVDPCSYDVLSSPSCPGYLDAIAKLAPQPTSTTTTEPLPTDPVVLSSPTVTTTMTTTNAVTQPTVNSTSTTETTSSPTTTASSSTTNTSVTPSATDPQPKVGEVSVPGGQPKTASTSMSTSQLLSIVNSEQSRISKLEISAAQSAVQQAQQAADQAMAESQSFVSATVGQSTNSALGIGPRSSLSSSVALASTGVGLRGPDSAAFNQTFQTTRSSDDRPNNDNKDLTNNPVNGLLNSNAPLTSSITQSSTGPAVKKNVKDNDAAGGVSLASIARQPIGYEAYMASLQDRPFYPPKEIYKGQKVVDNARAQRLLNSASDRLHQQMVDQQYNLGQ